MHKSSRTIDYIDTVQRSVGVVSAADRKFGPIRYSACAGRFCV